MGYGMKRSEEAPLCERPDFGAYSCGLINIDGESVVAGGGSRDHNGSVFARTPNPVLVLHI